MSASAPPLDSVAAARWATSPRLMASESPWLHEEVARRMGERLDWIRLQPDRWLAWEPLRGGLQAHDALLTRYPQSQAWVHTRHPQATELALQAQARAKPALTRLTSLFKGSRSIVGLPESGQVQMLWANMQLHTSSAPEDLLAQWHRLLAVDGFVMFSCLGPDTLQSLRGLYDAMGWGAPAQPFTDMHDWGDMLVHAGFAEPVMDMERITLSFPTPERLVQELRELGRNLAPIRQRVQGLRGRAWKQRLLQVLAEQGKRDASGALTLEFEVIYGHAIKPQPRAKVSSETSISLEAMRQTLRKPR